MNKLLILLLAAVAVQARFIPEIEDAIVRFPEMMRISNMRVGGAAMKNYDGKVIGGNIATNDQFPHQVHLLTTIGVRQYFCGGSILTNKWILTAAHCVDGVAQNAVTVTTGDTDRSRPDGEVEHTSASYTKHERYDSRDIQNDIAVVQVTDTIQFVTGTGPICLASTADAAVGSTVRLSGWGKTVDSGQVVNQLQWVDLTVITNTLCAATYGTASVTAGNICTSTTQGQGSCGGDSGGPLTQVIGGTLRQVGIVSYGSASSCTAGPSAFTRVTFFHDWITQIVAGTC